jgi:hypothetical protein
MAMAAALIKAEFRRFPRLMINESSSRSKKKQMKHTAIQVYHAPLTGTFVLGFISLNYLKKRPSLA